jgi:hypothetical protein
MDVQLEKVGQQCRIGRRGRFEGNIFGVSHEIIFAWPAPRRSPASPPPSRCLDSTRCPCGGIDGCNAIMTAPSRNYRV